MGRGAVKTSLPRPPDGCNTQASTSRQNRTKNAALKIPARRKRTPGQ